MVFEYIVLGIIQGIFEWIPISSEGVVAIFSNLLLKGVNPVDVALFLHLGTALAVFIYFRKEWKEVLLLRDKKLFKFLLQTTVISLVVAYPLLKFVKSMALGSSLLILTGLGLFLTSYFLKIKKSLNKRNNLLVGVLQGLAVIPGLSRSGSTIFALSLSEKDPRQVLKLSYMMSVPVGIISFLYLSISEPTLLSSGWPALISSFIVGAFGLHLLFKIINKVNFSRFTLIFGIICVIGGIIGLLL